MIFSKTDVNKRWIHLFLEVEKAEAIGSRAEAARRLNIQPQRLNEILQGRMNVGTDVIQKSVIEFGFNLFYIFFEKLPLFLPVEEYLKITERNTQALTQPPLRRMQTEPDLSMVNEPVSQYEKKFTPIQALRREGNITCYSCRNACGPHGEEDRKEEQGIG